VPAYSRRSYFPNGTIFDVDLGAHPSQIWRSIFHGIDILAQILVRRIGNGRSTHIWTHNWLPCESMLRPVVPLIVDPPQMVSQLIDETSTTWKENFIRS
jgi:hypothetical protein